MNITQYSDNCSPTLRGTYIHIKSVLHDLAQCSPIASANYFKTGKGDYAEHDQFLGVPVPLLRKLVKEFPQLSITEIQLLLASKINEERLLALLMLVQQYQSGSVQEKENIYHFYMQNLQYVNNWNLVDSSAHLIVGAHLLHQDKNILMTLATSDILWKKRIAIVATWYFIKNNQFEWTIKIANTLMNDTHDLIHKAVGWMLREMGKRDLNRLIEFLNQYAGRMPRTMLRYAIEKLSQEERMAYLSITTHSHPTV